MQGSRDNPRDRRLGGVIDMMTDEHLDYSSEDDLFKTGSGSALVGQFVGWVGGLYLTNRRLVFILARAAGRRAAARCIVDLQLGHIRDVSLAKTMPLLSVTFLAGLMGPQKGGAARYLFGSLFYLFTQRLKVTTEEVAYVFDVVDPKEWLMLIMARTTSSST